MTCIILLCQKADLWQNYIPMVNVSSATWYQKMKHIPHQTIHHQWFHPNLTITHLTLLSRHPSYKCDSLHLSQAKNTSVVRQEFTQQDVLVETIEACLNISFNEVNLFFHIGFNCVWFVFRRFLRRCSFWCAFSLWARADIGNGWLLKYNQWCGRKRWVIL